MDMKALKFWLELDDEEKQDILETIFCNSCKIFVPIVDHKMELIGDTLILNGFCASCSNRINTEVTFCKYEENGDFNKNEY